jgi:hypothetical protein
MAMTLLLCPMEKWKLHGKSIRYKMKMLIIKHSKKPPLGIKSDNINMQFCLALKASFPMGVQTSKAESFESRKSIFIRTHYEITEHNSNNNSTYQMEHNIFSVMVEKKHHNISRF